MRYWYDTEFLEDGKTIELISLGMVAEDGREFYGIDRDAPWKRIAKHDWLMENVVSSLPVIHGDERLMVKKWKPPHMLNFRDPAYKTRAEIAAGVVDLIGNDPFPQLWAYYAAYDHVALCQLWGRMLDLPKGVPMWSHDLKQERERYGNPTLPEQAEGEHNALADARWNRDAHLWLEQQGTPS